MAFRKRCMRGHDLTPDNVIIAKNLSKHGYVHRLCRICRTEYMRKYDVERKIKKILGAKCEATS